MFTTRFRPTAYLSDGARKRLTISAAEAPQDRGRIFDLEIANQTGESLSIERVKLFSVELGVKTLEVFRQGFVMPSDPSGFYVLEPGRKTPPAGRWKPACHGDWDFFSHTLVVTKLPRRNKMALLAFTTCNRFEGYFILNTRGKTVSLSAWCYLEGIKLSPGERIRLEQIMVAEDADFNRCLETYAEYVGRLHGAILPKRTLTGWMDWQYYRRDKTQKDIVRNVKALKLLKDQGYPLDYVIIDGGWCAHNSEWLGKCEKFPSGMKKLSRIVRKHGLRLGLWLAPYITNVKTRVVREHPEWLVKDARTGKPLYLPGSNVGPCHLLDFTVPEALEWLRNIVRVMVKEWKIGYLKLDGPRMAFYERGAFHNRNMTAIEEVRRSLEVIREECGRDVIVEGEGIYLPAVGLVETQRTTQDNHPYWRAPETGGPLLKENMKNDLLSAFLHNRFWHNLRENVILRDFPSPLHALGRRAPNAKEPVLPENELILQLSATALVGGAMFLTDPMDELQRNPKKIELISRFLPHYEPTHCRSIDVFKGGKQPSLYYVPIERDFEQWFVLGVFNWEDTYQDYRVPVRRFAGQGSWHAFDYWNEEYLGLCRDQLDVGNVPAHGCKVIALRRNLRRPQLMGTNMHILQGAVDIQTCTFARNRLQIMVGHFMQKERKLFIRYPRRYMFNRIETNAKDYLVDARKKGILTIQFNGRKRTDFRLWWRKR